MKKAGYDCTGKQRQILRDFVSKAPQSVLKSCEILREECTKQAKLHLDKVLQIGNGSPRGQLHVLPSCLPSEEGLRRCPPTVTLLNELLWRQELLTAQYWPTRLSPAQEHPMEDRTGVGI